MDPYDGNLTSDTAIVTCGVIGLAAIMPNLPTYLRISIVLVILVIICLMYWFYRSPPIDKSKYGQLNATDLVSAAYGTVEEIDSVDPDIVERDYGSIIGSSTTNSGCCNKANSFIRVKIFLSPLDVHVQCAPIDGATTNTYVQGTFHPAGWLEKSQYNERNITKFITSTENPNIIFVVLIAGVLARTIEVLKEGSLKRGDKYAMIKLGSRVDMIFPSTYTVKVKPGDYVIAGETIIAQ